MAGNHLSGFVTQANVGADLVTQTYARRRQGNNAPSVNNSEYYNVFTQYTVVWGRNLVSEVLCAIASNADPGSRVLAAMWRSSGWTNEGTSDTPNGAGIALLCYPGLGHTTWHLMTAASGASRTFWNTGLDFVASQILKVRIESTDAGANLKLYVNDVLLTTTNATLPPAGTALAPGNAIVFTTGNGQNCCLGAMYTEINRV